MTKIYHGALDSVKAQVGEIPPVSLLYSYFYCKGKAPKPPEWAHPMVFMDSGAFSALTQKVEIKLGEYAEFLRLHGSQFEVMASLDVIGDPKASWLNWMALEDQGLTVMPTIHRGTPLHWLDKMVDAGAKYIGLGGMAKCTAAQRHAFLEPVFQKYPDPSKVGFHGFGIGRDHMLAYPWKSVDSTSIGSAARMGCLYHPFTKDVSAIVPESKHYTSVAGNPGALETLKNWVEGLGYDWTKCTEGGSIGATERTKVMLSYFEDLATKTPTRYNSSRRFII